MWSLLSQHCSPHLLTWNRWFFGVKPDHTFTSLCLNSCLLTVSPGKLPQLWQYRVSAWGRKKTPFVCPTTGFIPSTPTRDPQLCCRHFQYHQHPPHPPHCNTWNTAKHRTKERYSIWLRFCQKPFVKGYHGIKRCVNNEFKSVIRQTSTL